MWRLTAFVKRQGQLNDTEFKTFLTEQWAVWVNESIAEKGQLQTLVINSPLDLGGSGLESIFPPVFDVLIELWFDSYTDAITALQRLDALSPQFDVSDYIDADVSIAWLGEVWPKKPNQSLSTGVRMSVSGHVADGVSVEDAQKYWGEMHPVIARQAPETWDRLTCYTQVHGRDTDQITLKGWLCPYQFFPMGADMGAASMDELMKAYDNDQYMSIVRPDEQKFSKPENMLTFIMDKQWVMPEKNRLAIGATVGFTEKK